MVPYGYQTLPTTSDSNFPCCSTLLQLVIGDTTRLNELLAKAFLKHPTFWSRHLRRAIHSMSIYHGRYKDPRPFDMALHVCKPNALIQSDYLELGTSSTSNKYVLMLQHDHFNYFWLFPFPDTNAEHAVHALVNWRAVFGVREVLMSDTPTNSKNEHFRLFPKSLPTPHQFTLPYCPWSNGQSKVLGERLLEWLVLFCPNSCLCQVSGRTLSSWLDPY